MKITCNYSNRTINSLYAHYFLRPYNKINFEEQQQNICCKTYIQNTQYEHSHSHTCVARVSNVHQYIQAHTYNTLISPFSMSLENTLHTSTWYLKAIKDMSAQHFHYRISEHLGHALISEKLFFRLEKNYNTMTLFFFMRSFFIRL